MDLTGSGSVAAHELQHHWFTSGQEPLLDLSAASDCLTATTELFLFMPDIYKHTSVPAEEEEADLLTAAHTASAIKTPHIKTRDITPCSTEAA